MTVARRTKEPRQFINHVFSSLYSWCPRFVPNKTINLLYRALDQIAPGILDKLIWLCSWRAWCRAWAAYKNQVRIDALIDAQKRRGAQ